MKRFRVGIGLFFYYQDLRFLNQGRLCLRLPGTQTFQIRPKMRITAIRPESAKNKAKAKRNITP